MTGGPWGFPGAERYQYNESNAAGRAIEGVKKLKAEGNAPEKLVVAMADGAVGSFTKPFPAGAPTVLEVFEKETGVKVELIGVALDDLYAKMMQDVTTEAGLYDVYCTLFNYYGDLVDAGGIVPLDDYVAKYAPDWDDPERGTATKELHSLLYKYAGKIVGVSLDGDFWTWYYRKDLFADPKHQQAFGDKNGYALRPPVTWQEVDAVAAYFKSTGINGHSNFMGPTWGIGTWFKRYASRAKPNFYLFDEAGNPLIDTDEGVKNTEEHLQYAKYSGDGCYTWGWFEAYGSMAEGTSAMTGTNTNLAKFLDRPESASEEWLKTKIGGKLAATMPPGHQFGDELVRRTCFYGNVSTAVSSQSKYPEVAYLFNQWAGSTTIYPWLSANLAGYMDPFQISNFKDPFIIESYHDYAMEVIQETVKVAAPTLNLSGAQAMHNALDENLQAAFAGSLNAKEAMQNTAKRWRQIMRKKGETKMIDAILEDRKAWPTTIDKMPT